MFCNQCGAQIPDGQLTCPVCGAYVGSEQQNVQVGGYGQNGYQQNMQAGGYGQNGYQQNMQAGDYGQNGYQQNMQPVSYGQTQPQLGMKWFQFIIWFQLFLSALTGVVNGYSIMTGSHYDVSDWQLDYIYNVFDGLKTLDVVTGIAFIALGIFALITRFVLAGFKKAGPAMYLGLLTANIVFSIIYIAVFCSIVDSMDGITSSTLVNLVTCIALLIANAIYFKNRKHMFVK